MSRSRRYAAQGTLALAALTVSLAHVQSAQAQSALTFTADDLVVAVEGNGSNTAATQSGNTGADIGTYIDNEAAPLSLYEFSLSGTSGATQVGSMMLPQVSTAGGNYAVSGEYGSSSEGTLQLSGNGEDLTIMGYGVNATSYNQTYDENGSGTALAQSPIGTSSGDVSRVVALIGANGSVNSTTALTNVFNENNPRSVYTENGTTFYVSGQGNHDATGGVFYTTLGATTATAITGQDTNSKSYGSYDQDTRDVQIVNGQLTVSVDSSEGSSSYDIDRIGTLGTAGNPPTTTLNEQPQALTGLNGPITLKNGNGNAINGSTGSVDLSPDNFFYANSTTLYVADTGDPKNGGLGDGGLQKWSLIGSTWTLDYTLSTGLNLVPDTDKDGVSGLFGLTGKVVGDQVELFATSYVLGDTDQTYLYGISDLLSAGSASQVTGEGFTTLALAPADADFKGVAFAPVPLPPTLPLMLGGLGLLALAFRSRKSLPVLSNL